MWFKSSYSADGTCCVEVWSKSSHSGNGGCCVEVRDLGGGVAVRDSKNPDGPHLHFTAEEWAAFLAGVKDHEFG